MNLPEIGDIITTKKALELCRHFSLDYLIDRIESNPKNIKTGSLTAAQACPMKLWDFSQAATGKTSHTSAACPMIFVMLMETREIKSKENRQTTTSTTT